MEILHILKVPEISFALLKSCPQSLQIVIPGKTNVVNTVATEPKIQNSFCHRTIFP